jgi:hypothetical protein
MDSILEEGGFELWVPPERKVFTVTWLTPRTCEGQEALPGFEPAALSDTRLHHLKITEFHF